jgi:hypothetical protein
MRSHRFFIVGAAITLSIGMLYAGKKHENWIDEPYTKWDQKQVSELFNKSAWAQTKEFRGQVGITGQGAPQQKIPGQSGGTMGTAEAATGGTDVPEYSFTARLFSAQPIREAYVRLLQLRTHYDQMPANQQQAFDQKVGGLVHADFSQEVLVTLFYHTNDPNALRDMNQWFNTQTAETLNQNVYLYTPAGQIQLLKYRAPQGNAELGAQFIFPRLFKGEPILQPGAGKMRFQISYQPQIGQIMYIDFDPKQMTYKDQLSY